MPALETLLTGSATSHNSLASEQRLVVMWRETFASSKASSLSQRKVKELKVKLAEALFAYKQELAGYGREGRWSAFLR